MIGNVKGAIEQNKIENGMTADYQTRIGMYEKDFRNLPKV
jgi:hypothetical protein